ncbi:hypothetical protein OWT79_11015 [Bacteroides fragilis]|nr:hypothetical protein [Bacteroides fragilis]
MGIKHIINREKKNDGCIYFYVISDDKFVAYEQSAYILTHLYPSITLENKYVDELGTNIYMAQFGVDLCREHFSGDNVLVGDDFIQVSVAWGNRVEYEEWINNFVRLHQ